MSKKNKGAYPLNSIVEKSLKSLPYYKKEFKQIGTVTIKKKGLFKGDIFVFDNVEGELGFYLVGQIYPEGGR